MKHIILTLLISSCTLSINAQTKRVSHRSHNGTLVTYYEFENDNLGLSGEQERYYDSIYRAKKKLRDSLLRVKQIPNTKVNKPKSQKKEKVKKDTLKKKATPKQPQQKQQKTKPLPPNDESRNKNKPKSNYFLLFLVAVPVSAVAFFSRKI